MRQARKSRNLFGWLTKKKETYRRSAKDERAEMARERAAEAKRQRERERSRRADEAELKRRAREDAKGRAAHLRDRALRKRALEAEERAELRREELAQRKAKLERKKADAIDRQIEREWREKGYRNPKRSGARFLLQSTTRMLGSYRTESAAFNAAKKYARSRRDYVTVEDQKSGQKWRFDPWGGQGGVNPCARTLKSNVSDRAQRYRANQPGCRPSGLKKCKLCGSRSDVMIDHVDGNESNGRKSNLRWLCRSCNNTLGARMAAEGQGRRTVQYNPKGGAGNFAAWSEAIATIAGEGLGTMSLEKARAVVRATSKRKRSEFQEDVWRIRKERYGPSGRKDGGAGGASADEPDWVTNPAASAAQYRLAQAVLSGTARTPTRMTRKVAQEIVDSTPANLRSEYSRNPALEFSTEYHLGYNLGQADRQSAQLRKTIGELHATFATNFGEVPSASLESFDQAYQAGYGGQIGVAVPNPEMRPDQVQVYPSTRRKGKWDVFVGGIHRATKATRKGAESYAQRIRDENPETTGGEDLEDDGSEQYQQAKRIAELFHGRPVKEHITVTESIHTPDWYAALGPLVELRIKGFKGAPFRRANFKFPVKEGKTIQFFASPDGKQFYLRGGDQEIDLDALGMGPDSEWYRDSMLIGEVTYFVYRDGKRFHGYKLTDYSHKVGSALDSTGTRHVQKTNVKPVMVYDTLSKKISLAGGLGRIEMETLVENMSPGIVS